MASRLIDAGDRLTVWNRTRAKTAPLATMGAAVANSITDLGACDVVFVMVSAPSDVEEVVMGDRGLLSGERRPGIIVDCSTVSVQTSAHVRAAARAVGTGFIAAPVSGNPHVVAEGETTLGCVDKSGKVQPLPEFLRGS